MKKKKTLKDLKSIQLDLHKDFIKVVEKSRGSKLKKDPEKELFSGEFWSGSKAKDLGLDRWHWKCKSSFKRKIWRRCCN